MSGSIRKTVDYSLYLVTDRRLAKGRPTLDIVRAAVQGGVTCVQLREKSGSTREFLADALTIRDFLQAQGIALIINDRVDIAQAVGADGVHLGQTDMPLALARALVGDSMLIGISVASLDQAVQAQAGGADYLGVSPIYPTLTKTDTAAPLGLQGLHAIRRAVNLPLVGIGGVNQHNAAPVIQHGAAGIAVVSAIVAAAHPAQAARQLRREIERVKATA